jgi:hypothetical protein
VNGDRLTRILKQALGGAERLRKIRLKMAYAPPIGKSTGVVSSLACLAQTLGCTRQPRTRPVFCLPFTVPYSLLATRRSSFAARRLLLATRCSPFAVRCSSLVELPQGFPHRAADSCLAGRPLLIALFSAGALGLSPDRATEQLCV